MPRDEAIQRALDSLASQLPSRVVPTYRPTAHIYNNAVDVARSCWALADQLSRTSAIGLCARECGCDGTQPCGEPFECTPAVRVSCEDCYRKDTEWCIYPDEQRLEDGCWFPVRAASATYEVHPKRDYRVPTILADIFREQQRAKAKHGDSYMGRLQTIQQQSDKQDAMRFALSHAHAYAKRICEGPNPTRLAVLVEEVCELAEAIDQIPYACAEDELVQVAAMALAWLGIEDDS